MRRTGGLAAVFLWAMHFRSPFLLPTRIPPVFFFASRRAAGALVSRTDFFRPHSTLPVADEKAPNHVEVLSRLALRFAETVPKIAASFASDPDLKEFFAGSHTTEIRLGIDTGAVIGGVIGRLLPRYRVFGDTVSRAIGGSACAAMQTRGRGACRVFVLGRPKLLPYACRVCRVFRIHIRSKCI